MELIGGILAAIAPGLIWWIHHDGPGRMYAQFVAASTVDKDRREGALGVLDQTKHLRSREPHTFAVAHTARRRRRRRTSPSSLGSGTEKPSA